MLFLMMQGIWLTLDIFLLQGLSEAGKESMHFYIWLASDVLLLSSVLLIALWSRLGVIVFLTVSAAREGLLGYNGKSLSIPSALLAILLLALVYRHWSHMQWGIVRGKGSAPAVNGSKTGT